MRKKRNARVVRESMKCKKMCSLLRRRRVSCQVSNVWCLHGLSGQHDASIKHGSLFFSDRISPFKLSRMMIIHSVGAWEKKWQNVGFFFFLWWGGGRERKEKWVKEREERITSFGIFFFFFSFSSTPLAK